MFQGPAREEGALRVFVMVARLRRIVRACVRVACFLSWRTAGLPVTACYRDFRGNPSTRFAFAAKGSLSHGLTNFAMITGDQS